MVILESKNVHLSKKQRFLRQNYNLEIKISINFDWMDGFSKFKNSQNEKSYQINKKQTKNVPVLN